MLSHIVTPKIILVAIGILMMLAWFVFSISRQDIHVPDDPVINPVLPVMSVAKNSEQKKYIPNGIYFGEDKNLVSINVSHMARLLVVQRIAEMAGFHFGLPDEDIDYWSEPLSISMQNKPISAALSLVIGTKKFTQEMSYDSSRAHHKISAIFLASASADSDVVASPSNKNQPLHSEKEYGSAPNINFAVNEEQKIKRVNFFSVDEQARVEILQEMSPVGEDLYYIVTSLRQDKSTQVRAVAAQRLAYSESYVATQSLIDALSDNETVVVQMAVESLVSLGDISVLSAMEEKLGASENTRKMLQDAALRIQSRFAIPSDSMH